MNFIHRCMTLTAACISHHVVHFLFWNFEEVYLRWTRAFYSISLAWIIRCNLKKLGENISFIERAFFFLTATDLFLCWSTAILSLRLLSVNCKYPSPSGSYYSCYIHRSFRNLNHRKRWSNLFLEFDCCKQFVSHHLGIFFWGFDKGNNSPLALGSSLW